MLEIVMKHLYGGGRNVGRPRSPSPRSSLLRKRKASASTHWRKKRSEAKRRRRNLRKSFLTQRNEIVSLKRRIDEAEGLLAKIKPASTLVMVEMNQTRETHVMSRGNYLSLKQKVDADVPESLHSWNKEWPLNRLGGQVASGSGQSLGRPRDGEPLVGTASWNGDRLYGGGFRFAEEPPTHPRLLDWLAVEFMENGWSMKHIHKLIALSGTYGQSSRVSPTVLDRDPRNLYFSRGPRLRMSAEMIRDNALRVSGLLSEKMGGPPVYPPQPDGLWRQTGRNEPKYVAAKNEDRFRRGVYVIWRRAAPYASFVNFDGPDRSSCFPKRSRTNTPFTGVDSFSMTKLMLKWLSASQPPSFRLRKACPADEMQIRMAFRRTLAGSVI